MQPPGLLAGSGLQRRGLTLRAFHQRLAAGGDGELLFDRSRPGRQRGFFNSPGGRALAAEYRSPLGAGGFGGGTTGPPRR